MLRLSLLLATTLTLVLCRSLPSNRDEDLICPDGWTLLESSCFLVSGSSGNWFEGQSFCNTLEASLATVSSASQQKALSGQNTNFRQRSSRMSFVACFTCEGFLFFQITLPTK
ncbi:C-type lectin domain family 2 member D-like [Penaeus japonicus]|uniref:C-type lectin domain family 2 member D-like n=1 Tax=Penaeus japonicus TaxID=27405 RepID=UPI001C70C8BC|nr:C-type lectin domain family 2 member D-like [Penaeus japonicus]